MPTAYQTAVLADSPSSFWYLDETSGSSITDHGSNGYTGTQTGLTLNQQGPPGQGAGGAPTFDSTDRVDAGDHYGFTANTVFTMSCWVYPTSLTGSHFLASKDKTSSPYAGWLWYLTGNKLGFERDGGSAPYYTGVAGTTALELNTWQHIAVTYDGTNIWFYINGVVDSAGGLSASRSIDTTTDTFRIGNYPDFSAPFAGKIANFAVWNGTALSASQLKAHFNSALKVTDSASATEGTATVVATTPVSASDSASASESASVFSGIDGGGYDAQVAADSPVSYWKLDEASGTSIADSAGSATGTATGIDLAQSGPGLVGLPGTAAYFDSTDRVNCGAVHSLSGIAAFTLEAWIKLDDVTGGKALMQRLTTGGVNEGWAWIVTGDKLLFERLGGGSYTDSTGGTSLTAGAWTHVAVTYDGSSIRFYINGVADSAGALSNTRSVTASTNAMLIGNYPSPYGSPAKAAMQRVAVYGSALSAARIAAHYASATTGGGVETATATDTASVDTGNATKSASDSATATDASALTSFLPRGISAYQNAASPAIVKGASGKWDDTIVYLPRWCKNLDGTLYRDSQNRAYLYYTGSGATAGVDRDRIGLMRTTDFQTWERVSTDNPVLGWGPSGTYDASGSVWDGTDVAACTVLWDGSQFVMFFEGNSTANEAGDNIQIGLATSPDGITWTKYGGNPIVTVGANGTDGGGDVYAPIVMKDGSTWKMWFGGHSGSHQPSSYGGNYGVMYATASGPSGPWTKYSTSYVFKPTENIGPEQIQKDADGTYRLVYANYDDVSAVKVATSRDGITWAYEKTLLAVGGTGAWDAGGVYWTDTAIDNGRQILAYTGRNTGATVYGIGVVVSVPVGSETATVTDTAGVTVGVGAVPKSASDSGSATDTATRSAVTRYVTATDSGVGTDFGGGTSTVPNVTVVTRPFFAPLDVSSVTAPLDIAAVTAPLDMTLEV